MSCARFDITDIRIRIRIAHTITQRGPRKDARVALSQESSISVRNNKRVAPVEGATRARGKELYGHISRIPRRRRTLAALYIFQLDGDIFRRHPIYLFYRERRGTTPKWRLNSPYILRPRGRVKLCISVDPSLSVSRPGRLIFEASPFRSYAYVPAARPENRCSRRECLAVASFASVNHGLNKIAYPRESNEMSVPGPPPSPGPGPNYSLTDSVVPLVVLSSRFTCTGNEDRCIRSRATIRLKEIAP